jgi:hypothetical protein
MYRILSVSLMLCLFPASLAWAHKAACHRTHSCPADPEAYVCGDLGHCTACPNNQYCVNRQSRRKAAASQRATPPATAQASKTKPTKAATADNAPAQPAQRPQAKAATVDKQPAQPAQRPQTKAATARTSPAQPAQRQPATHATSTAHSQEPSSHGPADDTQRQWDAYEQQLQAYCTQVAPTSVRQCMHGELARQDTEQARQRAKKYTAPRAAR